MASVTTIFPLLMTGSGATGFQTIDGLRLRVDCNVKLMALTGHDNNTVDPDRAMASCGGAADTSVGTMAVEPSGLIVKVPPLAGGSPAVLLTSLRQNAGSGE